MIIYADECGDTQVVNCSLLSGVAEMVKEILESLEDMSLDEIKVFEIKKEVKLSYTINAGGE